MCLHSVDRGNITFFHTHSKRQEPLTVTQSYISEDVNPTILYHISSLLISNF